MMGYAGSSYIHGTNHCEIFPPRKIGFLAYLSFLKVTKHAFQTWLKYLNGRDVTKGAIIDLILLFLGGIMIY